jgi:hypothetical protein
MMKCVENIWFGIPRKEIDWFPTINYVIVASRKL